MEVTVQSVLSTTPGHVTVATDENHTVDSLISAFCVEKGIAHRQEYVLRNSDHYQLDNVRKLSAAGVCSGDILYLGVRAKSDAWPVQCNQWWLLAVVSLLIGAAGLVAIIVLKLNGDKQPTEYGLVIDAGSSHSQLYIYKWPGDKNNGTAVAQQFYTHKAAGGGISGYTDHPSGAGASLRPSLDQAKERVPSGSQEDSTLFLGATAGMRLLHESDRDTCDQIMNSTKSTMSEYPFKFSSNHSKILPGSEEGAYSWVTVNYLMGNFGTFSFNTYLKVLASSILPETYGALDMGGASTQITFVPEKPDSLPTNYSAHMLLYGHMYTLYTHSYLCKGLNEAYRQYLAHIVKEQNYSENITDACRPKNNVTKYDYSEIFEVPCTASISPNSTKKKKVPTATLR